MAAADVKNLDEIANDLWIRLKALVDLEVITDNIGKAKDNVQNDLILKKITNFITLSMISKVSFGQVETDYSNGSRRAKFENSLCYNIT